MNANQWDKLVGIVCLIIWVYVIYLLASGGFTS